MVGSIFGIYGRRGGKGSGIWRGVYEEKLTQYDEYEEEDDLFWNESIRKLAYYVSFWESGQVETEEDFKSIDKMFVSPEKSDEKPKAKRKTTRKTTRKKAKTVAAE
jgi:hypothetical protein